MGSSSVCCFFFFSSSPTCITLPPSPNHLLLQSTCTNFHLRASSSPSPSTRRRRSRRLKSDDEIRDDIRKFLAAVGLPGHHIPSTKELLLHGRNDLANIVRRRGHKRIEELLTSSFNANIDSLDTEKGFDERPGAADDCEGLLTGQNLKVDSFFDDVTTSTEVCLGSSSDTDSSLSLDEYTSIPAESSANLTVDNGLGEQPKDHAEEVTNVVEENFYPAEVAVADNDCRSSREGFQTNFNSQMSMPTEISGKPSAWTKYSGNLVHEDDFVGGMAEDEILLSVVPSIENHYNTSFNVSALDTEDKLVNQSSSTRDLSLEQNEWCALETLDDSNNNIAEDVPSASEVSTMEDLSGDSKTDSLVHSVDSISINVDSSANLSLEEKVANFIQNGDLDAVEDHVSGISNGDDSQERNIYNESEPVVSMPLSAHPPSDNDVMELNGRSSTSKHVVHSGSLDQLVQDDHMPNEDQTTDFNKHADTEAPKVQNESEINHLKFMLYQKELELCRLKEQIEKEKLALSVLQTKAEAEISKAKKLVSEKDAELHVAEESLSGLKEVQVDFCGNGDVVEVAGSFNGWHHRIKMEPQPSASATDLGASRRSRFWSTTLWLYPGVYEIKFVVDGYWIVDPQRESVTRGHICNNILRVDR